jgi:hypothetical protein
VQHTAWEAYSLSSDQNIACLLWSLLLLCLLRAPMKSVVSWKMQSIYSCLISLRFTLKFSHLCISRECPCHSHFPPKCCTFLIYRLEMHHTTLSLCSVFNLPFNIRRTVNIMKFFMVHFSPLCSCRLLRSNVFHSLQFSAIVNVWEI